MPKRVALICEGFKSLEDSKDLKYLDNGVNKIITTLKKYGNWDTIEHHKLQDAGLLQNALKDIGEVEALLFYYIGHGKVDNTKFYIVGEENDSINLKNILEITEKWDSKVSVVLDACKSGQFINKWANEIPYEIFTSTDTKLAFEIDELEMSFFTYHFCRAIEENREFSKMTLENIYSKINDILIVKQKCFFNTTKTFGKTSNTISYNFAIDSVIQDLSDREVAEAPSKTDQIFLIFNEDNLSDISYRVTGYIQSENEFDSETIDFSFENIHDRKQQEEFIELLVDEFDDSITIHCILPHSLFLMNFKQWQYKGNCLVNRYHILLHNKENYESKLRKYKKMIASWTTLYAKIKERTIGDVLLPVDNGQNFDTRLKKMGIYFKAHIESHEKILDALDIAKIGLWQYQDGCIDEYTEWTDTQCLEVLECQSRNCDHMALVWDDMRLLQDLKEFA